MCRPYLRQGVITPFSGRRAYQRYLAQSVCTAAVHFALPVRSEHEFVDQRCDRTAKAFRIKHTREVEHRPVDLGGRVQGEARGAAPSGHADDQLLARVGLGAP